MFINVFALLYVKADSTKICDILLLFSEKKMLTSVFLFECELFTRKIKIIELFYFETCAVFMNVPKHLVLSGFLRYFR